jgi:hypothetical protein
LPAEERPFRSPFLERLNARFYEELKKHEVLSEWDPSELYDLAHSVIRRRKKEINSYLDQNEVTLRNADVAMDKIIHEILMPEIESLRI